MNRAPILAFSHLRWDSVFHRPHQIMSRLAARRDVLFVEEPVRHRGETEIEVRRVAPRLSLLTARIPDGSGTQSDLESALRKLLRSQGWGEFVAWLDTPMAVSLARALGPRAIVYDCMRELSALRFAPPELREREQELFQCADVVFTAGRSLYRAKRYAHRSVFCLPSSVDMAHFAGAHGIPEAREQEEIPHPRFGFFGVIDERMDLEILRQLAAERPEWQIVLVGPVVRMDETQLPRAANLHYMGPRAYADLPGYLAGWDVCLVPFAMNAATRFHSPSKVLEYMAADRPIVSTPITDVAEPYGDIVYLGRGATGFLEACDRALHDSEPNRSIRRALASQVLRQTSWEETVERMSRVLGRLDGSATPSVAPGRESWPGSAPVLGYAS